MQWVHITGISTVFAKISEAKMHDKKFMAHLNPGRGSMLVFDKAYNYYLQFAEWTRQGVNFVCRLKDNAKVLVQEVLFERTLSKEESGVYKVEHIHLDYKQDKQVKTVCLRLVHYKDEQKRKYKFITNNWSITPGEVALIYKYRWTIELSFKKLKQNFQLHFFYSDTENGIKAQVWCVDSTSVASSHPSGERKQESVLNCCSFDKDTLDKSSGVGMGGNRRSEGIY